jgi:hypothetical protein
VADSHVISALRSKYAELVGLIAKHERDVERWRTDAAHIEAAIRMFDSGHDVASITGKRPKKPSRWVRQGHGTRTALEVLKQAERPLTAHEIALASMRLRGMPIEDGVTVKAVAASLRGSLMRRNGKGVIQHDGFPKRWSLG